MSDIQAKVQQVLDEAVASGAERGVQAAVYQNGKLVVDAAAGVTDAESNTPVTPDTLFFATSTGKGLTSTIVHVLAERGVLDYDEPIAKSWPEFAAHGKENATLRQALSHTIGLPEMPGDITPEGLADWDAVCSFIADSEPWWTPGTKTGYHALSFGYIIGEVVRRKTGKPIDEVLDEVVAGPLGISKEVFFGVPESELGRVAKLEDVEGAAEALASMPADMPLFKAVPLGVAPQADIYNRPGYLKANVPGGGTMTARGVARVFAALAGEVDGVRLISDERLHEVAKPAATDEDQIFGFPATKTLGYDFGMPFKNAAETPNEFGAGGLNGSAASIDIATGTAIAVNKNRITMGDYSLFEKVAEVVREHVS
ncbi:CubicO group peptidase, beta-lactamase class C family [Amycolatopsis lurida]|uniref:Beta-lactamase n=1 Tax=Amycolatopsis lurida NRRL 2430 TaxID=1460371 RepID=A0A2P2FFL3_AMYLU|nr:serine hydrolase domain-containing protein [Amycolatopsis lurida]KFU75520.1 beta-lactamase [Amycolatopsis lurida NRRL 2430]SEE45102.1 CubicO group peptidase, beta-lactamase class C family [Amycolatopsis lurida]